MKKIIHEGFLNSSSLNLAHAWNLTRKDGVSYNYTDHDQDADLGDGNLYTPVNSPIVTDNRGEINLKQPLNFDVKSAIDGSLLTFDDFRAGLMDDAVIVESLFDWRFPWMGPMTIDTYTIQNITFSGRNFDASLIGPASILKQTVGKNVTRLCPYTLGDSNCRFPLVDEFTKDYIEDEIGGGFLEEELSSSSSNFPSYVCEELGAPFLVTGIVLQRRVFTSSALIGHRADDDYKFGILTFRSGPNAGLSYDLKSYTASSGQIETRVDTAFDFSLSESFSIKLGCDKSLGRCKDFDNVFNFGGMPFTPGRNEFFRPFR